MSKNSETPTRGYWGLLYIIPGILAPDKALIVSSLFHGVLALVSVSLASLMSKVIMDTPTQTRFRSAKEEITTISR